MHNWSCNFCLNSLNAIRFLSIKHFFFYISSVRERDKSFFSFNCWNKGTCVGNIVQFDCEECSVPGASYPVIGSFMGSCDISRRDVEFHASLSSFRQRNTARDKLFWEVILSPDFTSKNIHFGLLSHLYRTSVFPESRYLADLKDLGRSGYYLVIEKFLLNNSVFSLS